MPCANYRYNRNQNNVVSTEIIHIIWLSTAEQIDILYLSAIQTVHVRQRENTP